MSVWVVHFLTILCLACSGICGASETSFWQGIFDLPKKDSPQNAWKRVFQDTPAVQTSTNKVGSSHASIDLRNVERFLELAPSSETNVPAEFSSSHQRSLSGSSTPSGLRQPQPMGTGTVRVLDPMTIQDRENMLRNIASTFNGRKISEFGPAEPFAYKGDFLSDALIEEAFESNYGKFWLVQPDLFAYSSWPRKPSKLNPTFTLKDGKMQVTKNKRHLMYI